MKYTCVVNKYKMVATFVKLELYPIVTSRVETLTYIVNIHILHNAVM